MNYRLQVVTKEPRRRVELAHRNLRKYGTVYNTLAAVCEVNGEMVAVQLDQAVTAAAERLIMATSSPIVVVGIDGSESSKHALRWAARQAEKTGAELVTVTAWHLPDMYRCVSRDCDIDAAQVLEAVLKEVLDPASAVPVTMQAAEGRPATVLLEASKEADLLVLDSHGHGAFDGTLLGSVSQHCLHHATCPVVVVPSPRH